MAAIAARGEPTRYDAAYPEPKTDEQRQAASLYTDAADAARERMIEENNRAARLDVDKPGGAELPLDEIRANYRDDDPALQLLDRATPLDFAGFDDEQRSTDTYQYSGLESSLTALGSLACLRADLASTRGDGDAAVAALVPCIRLQRTLYSDSYRSTHATRIAGSVRILLRHTVPSAAALLAMQRALDSWPDEDIGVRSALLDRARFIGRSRAQVYPGLLPALIRIVFHPVALRGARRALESYDRSIAITRLPPAERWKAAEDAQRTLLQEYRRNPPRYFARLIDPFGFGSAGLAPWIRGSTYDLAARRVVATTVAMERYRRAHDGRPAASLDALVPAFLPRVPEDPFSGKPLVYSTATDGYVVYSVDSNRKDDGGTLYGFGAAPRSFVGPQSPRDLGIRIPLALDR